MYKYPVAEYIPQKISFGKHIVEDGYEWMRDDSSCATKAFTSLENDFTEKYFASHSKIFDKYMDEQREMAKSHSFKEIIKGPGGIYALCVYADGVSYTVNLNHDFTFKEQITGPDFLKGVNVHAIYPNPVYKNICILNALKDKAERTCGLVYDISKREVLYELEKTFSSRWSVCGRYAYYCKAEHREDGTIENTLCRFDIETKSDDILYTYEGHAAYGNVYPMDDGGVIVNFEVDYHASAIVIFEKDGTVTEVGYDGNARHYIGTIGNKHLFITDKDAVMGQIVAIKKGDNFQNSTVYIGETDEKISDAYVNNGKIICIYENAGSQNLCVYNSNKVRKNIELPCEFGSLSIVAEESKSEKPLFTYESFSVPSCVMELDLDSQTAKVIYQSEKVCSDVKTERVYYKSRDGIRLAAYIVRKNNVIRNKNNKTLFYGYGGYNATNYVASEACGMSIVKWLEDGGIYVHCIIRGGGEYGEDWHRGGWKENKKNVFNDFCDITEGVISDNWTNPSKIAICGLSNGGLLMAALITRRPDLFGCVIASVPQTDMLGFVNDARGSMYITEYGDPREDHMFEYIKSYSPYHNIRKDVNYPGIYIQAGAMDNNVPAYHAKKFAAKMQELGRERPVLLRVLPFGSHDRGTGEYYHRTIAEMRTFIDIELNLVDKSIG